MSPNKSRTKTSPFFNFDSLEEVTNSGSRVAQTLRYVFRRRHVKKETIGEHFFAEGQI